MNNQQTAFIGGLNFGELSDLIHDIYYAHTPPQNKRIINYRKALKLGLAGDNAEALAEELVLRCRLTCI